MNTTNLFKIALKAIASNKLRSFLTALGIIIGVASVIAMLAIGQGSKRSIRKQISEMGSNMIMIHPGADMRGGVRLDADEMQTLKLEDYESIRNEAKYLTAVSPSVNSAGQFIYGNNNAPSSIYGVNEDYLTIQQRKVADGEFFTEQDIKTAAKVCVLGQTVVDNLFPDGSSPIGRVVRFNSIPFRVVGVLKSKGYNSWGMDQDDMALAPYTTVMKRILAVTFYALIAFDTDKAQQAVQDLSRLLRHLLYDNNQDFIPLNREMEFLKNYVALMKIRLSSNVDLQFHIDIPSENPIRVAPLIFISLFENAFKHGISPVKPSFIHIKIYSSGPDTLSCSIENSYFPKQRNDISGSGIGLEQVQKRLDLIYPDKYEWTKGCDENATVYKSILTIHTTTK